MSPIQMTLGGRTAVETSQVEQMTEMVMLVLLMLGEEGSSALRIRFSSK